MRQSVRLLAVVLAAALPAAALATTLVFVDVPARARGASAIVHGKVLSSQARWSGDGRRIFTETVVEVTDTWKGAPAQTVTVRQPGGQVGDLGQRVDGVAAFRDGEEVVLFLEAQPGGAFLLFGMAQGKFRVERPGDGENAFAIPEATGEALLLDPVTRQPVTARHQPLELGALRREVAQAVGSAPGPEDAAPPTQKVPAGRTGKTR